MEILFAERLKDLNMIKSMLMLKAIEFKVLMGFSLSQN
jgi:hypothetical protein